MPVLSLNLSMYKVTGIWRPIEWSSNCSKLLHGMYCLLVMYLMTFVMLAEFLDIIVVVDNIGDFISNFLLFISVISATCKMFISMIRHERIMTLIGILEKEPCRACGQEEMDIQARFDRVIRYWSINYMVLVIFSVTGGVVAAVFDGLHGKLPFNTWVPYDCSSSLLFWLTSLQITIAMLLGAIINVATETSVLGFCLQACAQIDILKHRLLRMVKTMKGLERSPKNASNCGLKSTSVLSAYVRHHLCIIRYSKIFNEMYSQVFFVQFFISILVLCSCVYFLSSHVNFMDLMTMICYTFSMFVQIFIYCWAGNEVILKSTELSDAVYQMNWMLMEISKQKDLLMIMKRSTVPIKFTGGFFVTLSLESYGNILKASYSAFSVLQQS